MRWIKSGIEIDEVRGTQCSEFECECFSTATCHVFRIGGGGSGGGVW